MIESNGAVTQLPHASVDNLSLVKSKNLQESRVAGCRYLILEVQSTLTVSQSQRSCKGKTQYNSVLDLPTIKDTLQVKFIYLPRRFGSLALDIWY